MDKIIYSEPWFLYIVECQDTTLYVGIAKDVDKRINAHNNTSRCRYTRFRRPVVLKYKELCSDYRLARKRELEVKKFGRKKKLALIDKMC